MKASIGIDIGGTNTVIGVVSAEGTVIAERSFETRLFDSGTSFVKRLAEEIEMLNIAYYKKHPGGEMIGIGIGAPNGNHHSGCIEEPPNLRFKGKTPIVELLKKHIAMGRVELTNDANAAAIGEKLFGAAQTYSDFIMVTLGTGLGSGVYVNDQLVYGHDGFAGELGHISIIPDGRYCGFGRRGSLENYCSATGIRRTFFEMIAQRGDRTLLDKTPVAEISSKMIADAALDGDPTAQATYDFTGRLLGEALASTALITSPKAFFLFGGPVKAGDLLLKPTRKAFEQHLIPPFKNKIRIIESALPMGSAAILGAAALVQA